MTGLRFQYLCAKQSITSYNFAGVASSPGEMAKDAKYDRDVSSILEIFFSLVVETLGLWCLPLVSDYCPYHTPMRILVVRIADVPRVDIRETKDTPFTLKLGNYLQLHLDDKI